MAREGKKLQHIHSSVPGKQPKPEVLEVGELAVNNSAGNEFISTKNTDDVVVRFSSDNKMVTIIEKKEVLPYEGSVLEPTEQDLIDNKSQLLIKLNQVAASETFGSDAVNGAVDMHGDEINPFNEQTHADGAGFAIDMDRYAMIGANPSFSSVTTNAVYAKGDELLISGNTVRIIGLTDDSYTNNYVKSGSIENDGTIRLEREGLGDVSITGLSNFIAGATDDNYVASGSVNENTGVITLNRQNGDATVTGLSAYVDNRLDDLSGIPTDADYITSGDTKVIVFKDKDGNVIDNLTIDATDFIKDGMVNNVTISDVESGATTVKCLVIAFNTDAGKENINIPISDIFDESRLDGYYTKEQIDCILGEWFNAEDCSVSSVTDVILEVEHTTSAALNDLNSRVIEVSGDVKSIDNRVTILEGKQDNFVEGGNVDSGTGVITLDMSAGEDAYINGLSEYIEGKISSVSGDTNDYVTGGSVNANTGVITLNVKNQNAASVTGLSTFVEDKTDGLFKTVEYISSSETIIFKDKDGDEVGTIDASRFVKDGMVLSVEVGTPTSGQHAGEDCLIITWNNDSAPDVNPLITEIPLSEFFDPAVLDDYYTKTQIDDVLGEYFNAGNVTSSVTDVIKENELVVAAALNDLNSRVIEVSGDVITNTNNIENLDERVTILEGREDKYLESGSFDQGTLTLNMSDGSDVRISGISTGEGADGNDFVSSGTINASTGVLTLNVKNQNPVTINGLSDYVSAHDSNDYVTGGSVNDTTGAITLNMKSGGTASVTGLSDYLSKNDKYVASGSVNSNTGVINLSMSDGSVKTVTGLSEYVSAHDNDDYVTGGSVNSTNGNITLNMKSGGTATVTGLNDYVSAHDKYITGGTFNSGTLTLVLSDNSSVQVPGISTGEGADGNDYVSGGSVNQTNGNITLGVTNGYVANVTGLSNYIDSKTSGFSTTDIQVNGGSINATSGVITLTRTDSKNPSSTVSSVDINGLKTFVDNEIAANDKYLSAGTINSTDGSIDLKLSNGNTVKVTGLGNYIDSLDDDHFLSGGSINQSNGNITLGLTNGNNVNVTGLSNYVDSKTSGFSTTDIQVSTGSVNTSNGVITLNRIDSKNTSATVSPVTIDGLATYVGSVVDDYLPLSGGVMTSGATIQFGSNVNNYIKLNGEGNLELCGAEEVSVFNDVNVDGNITTTSAIHATEIINDNSDDNFVLLGGGGTKLLSSIVPTDVWVNESGDTMTGTLKIASKSNGETYALEVTGDTHISGTVTATGAMYSSDKRLKENIKFIPGDDLENAKKIDFKEFNFIADKSSQKVGVIAQELKENGLGKFTKQNDAGYLTVDYISLLCLKIAQLEKEIKELKEGK